MLLNAAQSHRAASIKHQIKGGEYGIPDMLKELEYGIGKAYRDMSTGEKIVYGLALFAVAGVVADYTVTKGKYTKATKEKVDQSLQNVWKDIYKMTPAGAVSTEAVSARVAKAPPVSEPVVGANASVEKVTPTPTPVPEKYVLNYDGLPIIGTKQFIHDIVMVNEFAKKYSPADYEFIIKGGDTAAIEENTNKTGGFEIPSGGGDINKTSLGQNYLNCLLRGKNTTFKGEPAICSFYNHAIPEVLQSESHENIHNIKYTNEGKYNYLENVFDIHNAEEDLAIAAGKMTNKNNSKVPQFEIDEFMSTFDFSPFEKQIQVYK